MRDSGGRSGCSGLVGMCRRACRLVLSVALLTGSLTVAGWAQEDEPATVEPGGFEEQLDEVIVAVQDYSIEKKEEAARMVDAALEAVGEEIESLQDDAEAASDEVRADLATHLGTLEALEAQTADYLADLRSSGEEDWAVARKNLGTALEELRASLAEARDALET